MIFYKLLYYCAAEFIQFYITWLSRANGIILNDMYCMDECTKTNKMPMMDVLRKRFKARSIMESVYNIMKIWSKMFPIVE